MRIFHLHRARAGCRLNPGHARLGLLAIVMALCGCLPTERTTGPGARSHQVEPIASGREIIGRSVEGRAIECVVFGDGPECVLIMATIHGNEDAGTPLVRHMIELMPTRPDLVAGRRIVFLPDANPDGRAAQTRENARGVDLNRNYPAQNFQASSRHGPRPLSEPESRVIDDVLKRFKPDRIISIHQPLNTRRPMIDYDGPAEELAELMASHCDIPVHLIGSRPGSLGSYAGVTLGIPIITLELPPEAKSWPPRVLWEKYGEMMIAAVKFDGAVTAASAAAQ